MTVQREAKEIVRGNLGDVSAAVRRILVRNPPYSRIVELEQNRRFRVNVKPHWWLAGTNMIIVLDEVETGINVSVQTVSQRFVFGDVFDCYRRYIRDFLEKLRKEI
jgi:hypothetical protein